MWNTGVSKEDQGVSKDQGDRGNSHVTKDREQGREQVNEFSKERQPSSDTSYERASKQCKALPKQNEETFFEYLGSVAADMGLYVEFFIQDISILLKYF